MTDYAKGIGDKWRVSYMHYTTGFKHKKNEKEIHLDNTYFLERVEKGNKVIPLDRRIGFTDVLINKIKLDSDQSINKRDRLFRFLDRLKTLISLTLIPVKINPHGLRQSILGSIEKIEYETKNLNVFQFRYDYSFEHNWGINLITSTSLQKKSMKVMLLGFGKKMKLK